MPKATNAQPKILDFVSSESRFTKFNEAIKAAGLTERFSSPNNFTVFAPTNEAFSKLADTEIDELLKPENREQLKRLLLLHVVPGILLSEDLSKAGAVNTEARQPIKVTVSPDRNEINVANANVILPKKQARNGILYPLDAVLVPMRASALI
jgi:uncharacterized surface protein with fasciclin (FAS1) repeats